MSREIMNHIQQIREQQVESERKKHGGSCLTGLYNLHLPEGRLSREHKMQLVKVRSLFVEQPLAPLPLDDSLDNNSPSTFPSLSSLQEFTYALRDTIDEIASDREICSETQGKLLNSLYAENTVELTKAMQEILWHIHDVNRYSNRPRSKYGKECRNAAIGYFEELDENARIKLREMEAQASQRPEHLHEQFLSRGSLPNENAMDKILRYETAIERQLYRAITELEGLQNRRTGEVLSIFVLMMQTQFGETKPKS